MQSILELRSGINHIRSVLKEARDLSTGNDRALDRIAALELDMSTERFPVGLLGPSGCGKTTLLNALLGERALPEGDSAEACTSAPVVVEWRETYRVEVALVSREAWVEEMKILLVEANDRETTAREVAESKLRAVYGDIQLPDILDSLPSTDATKCLGTEIISEPTNATEVSKFLEKYVTSLGSWWPCVETVRVFGPWKLLEAGLVLVDLPGLGDSNAARVASTMKHMTELYLPIVVVPMNRALSDDAADQLLLEHAVPKLLDVDLHDGLMVVVTKSDEGIAGEVKMNKYIETNHISREVGEFLSKFPPAEAKRRKRQGIVTHRMTHVGHKLKEKVVRAIEAKVQRQVNVEVVCVTAFQQLLCLEGDDDAFLEHEQTGITELQLCLSSIYEEPMKRLTLEIAHRARRFLDSLLRSMTEQNQHSTDIVNAASEIISDMMAKLEDLTTNAGNQLQSLVDSLPIQQGMAHVHEQRMTIAAAWGNMHWKKYEAAVRRNGVHEGINFNAHQSDPLLQFVLEAWQRLPSQIQLVLKQYSDQISAMLHGGLHRLGVRIQEELGSAEIVEAFRLAILGDHEANSGILQSGLVIREVQQQLRVAAGEPCIAVQRSLIPAYQNATMVAAMGGTGTFQRMKNVINFGVQQLDLSRQSNFAQLVQSAIVGPLQHMQRFQKEMKGCLQSRLEMFSGTTNSTQTPTLREGEESISRLMVLEETIKGIESQFGCGEDFFEVIEHDLCDLFADAIIIDDETFDDAQSQSSSYFSACAPTLISCASVGDNGNKPMCFVLGTLFPTPLGTYVRVESLTTGAHLLANDGTSLRVASMVIHPKQEQNLVYMKAGTAELTVTASHRIVGQCGGYPGSPEDFLAGNLEQGDRIVCNNGVQIVDVVASFTAVVSVVEIAFDPDKPVSCFQNPQSQILAKGREHHRRKTRRGTRASSAIATENVS